MRIHEPVSLLVSHSGLKLVYPDTRVDGHGLSFHGLQAVFRLASLAVRGLASLRTGPVGRLGPGIATHVCALLLLLRAQEENETRETM